MDLLDFEAEDLYFERPELEEVETLIKQASEDYSDGDAEAPLLKAYELAPQSLNVLVALNRFYYYQHRLEEALKISHQALELIREKIDFPKDWQALQQSTLDAVPEQSLTQLRLYLFTLKSVGFLNMRLHKLDTAKGIFEKLVELDAKDRIGAKGLLELVNNY